MNDLFYSHSLGLTVFELTCDRAVGALWKQHQRSGKHVNVLKKSSSCAGCEVSQM